MRLPTPTPLISISRRIFGWRSTKPPDVILRLFSILSLSMLLRGDLCKERATTLILGGVVNDRPCVGSLATYVCHPASRWLTPHRRRTTPDFMTIPRSVGRSVGYDSYCSFLISPPVSKIFISSLRSSPHVDICVGDADARPTSFEWSS